jgi:hypothetical protein
MMELLAPLLLAGLFIVFGLFYRGRGGCAGCAGKGACQGQEDCPQQREKRGHRGTGA